MLTDNNFFNWMDVLGGKDVSNAHLPQDFSFLADAENV